MQLNQVFDSLFNRVFRPVKCKTLLQLATSRMKLLQNKRELQLKQLRRELAELLQNGQDPTACIRVEHIIREQNLLEAHDSLQLFCELIVVRMPLIELKRECPRDLQEAIASVIFAAPLSSDIPELLEVQNMFAMKYGKEFVAAATELRPGCRVNRLIIEKLSARPPSVIMKLRTMKEIAEEHGVVWDSSNTEMEFSKLPADVLDGPNQFIGATGIAMIVPEEDETQSILLDTANFKSSLQEETSTSHSSHNSKLGSSLQCNDSFKAPVLPPFLVMPKSQEETTPSWFYSPPRESSASRKLGLVLKRTHSRTGSEGSMNLQDIIEAAEAAAESAEKAAQAAREVANLARSRIYPKSPGQPKNGGMYPMCSKIEQESSFDIKSKPYFTEETGNMQNEFQSMAEHYENSQKNQGEEDTGESGLYDNAKDVQAGEPVHFGQFERGKGSIIDSFEDDYNAVSISYPQALEKEGKDSLEDAKLFTSPVHLTPAYLGSVGESTEGHQSFYDALGPGEAEMRNHPRQPQRLPSLEDDPFFTYPNLFSRHSGA